MYQLICRTPQTPKGGLNLNPLRDFKRQAENNPKSLKGLKDKRMKSIIESILNQSGSTMRLYLRRTLVLSSLYSATYQIVLINLNVKNEK